MEAGMWNGTRVARARPAPPTAESRGLDDSRPRTASLRPADVPYLVARWEASTIRRDREHSIRMNIIVFAVIITSSSSRVVR